MSLARETSATVIPLYPPLPSPPFPGRNLETVPPLVDACINHIVAEFHSKLCCWDGDVYRKLTLSLWPADYPRLSELDPRHRRQVLDRLPTSVPLR